MNDIFVTYPGGKNGSGTFQKIINLMPPHRMYVEPFLGGGAILRAKRPAEVNVGIDLSGVVVEGWRLDPPAEIPNLTILHRDGIAWLAENATTLGRDCLVYCDPPYLMETRSSHRQLYTFELADRDEHEGLLAVLLGLPCMVMISGYWSEMYATRLADWRVYSFQAMTRGGKLATEWVWMNFPAPFELHDYRFLGETFRDREQIKRKKLRWRAKLERMPVLERVALLDAIQGLRSDNGKDDIVHVGSDRVDETTR